jgi:ribonuclease D
LIQKPADVAQTCARAATAGVVALDTESDSLHSYFHKVCLVQLSFAGESAVLDPLALSRDDLRPFVELLADAGVEKVLHGADYDAGHSGGRPASRGGADWARGIG